jgi:hypothetical protein
MAVPKLQYAIGNAASTTLSVAAANSDTSITLTSDTNFAAKSGAGMVIIDESQATEEIAYSVSKTGAVLSIPLVNRGLEGGSAQGHAINATVKGILTAGMWNDMIDSLTNFLNATTGAVDTTKIVDLTTAQTLTNKTLTTPKIVSLYQDSIGGSNLITIPAATDTLIGRATIDTLTNKRITSRVTTIVSNATPTVNTDNCDCVTITALAVAITSMTTNLTGTPTNFQKLIYRIKDDGTGRAITWGASFAAKGVALPTTTTANKLLTVGFIYDTVATTWGCVASATES